MQNFENLCPKKRYQSVSPVDVWSDSGNIEAYLQSNLVWRPAFLPRIKRSWPNDPWTPSWCLRSLNVQWSLRSRRRCHPTSQVPPEAELVLTRHRCNGVAVHHSIKAIYIIPHHSSSRIRIVDLWITPLAAPSWASSAGATIYIYMTSCKFETFIKYYGHSLKD